MEKVKFEGKSIEEISEIIEKGLTIDSFEASDIETGRIYKKNKETGETYIASKKGVLPNSIFTTILIKNGLRVLNSETEDVVYLNFKGNAKTQLGYLEGEIKGIEKDIKKLNKEIEKLQKSKKDPELLERKKTKKKEKEDLKEAKEKEREQLKANGNVSVEKGNDRNSLREKYYVNGFDIKKIIKGKENIYHYENIFQTSSKSRVGKTVFILTKINNKKHIDIEKVRNEITMGLHNILKDSTRNDIDLVSIQAYSTLVASGITNGYVTINPNNILVIKDKEVQVHCKAMICKENKDMDDFIIEPEDNYLDTNVLFDGQSLLDESYFKGKKANGFMLLRQHMFKSACFKCKLKDYIKNWCKENGKDYYNECVKDMFGREIKYCDIEMITTDNSLKFLKFKNLFNTDNIYEYWSNYVKNYDMKFSVVKYEKSSKYGELNGKPIVASSYQIINSLNCGEDRNVIIDNLKNICNTTSDYVNNLRNDDKRFEEYMATKLKRDSASMFWRRMIKLDMPVRDIKNFNEYRKKSTLRIIRKAEEGKLLLEGANLTMIGNPIEMIKMALEGKCENSFGAVRDNLKEHYVRAYSSRYNADEIFLGCRSPHNYESGLVLFENTPTKEIEQLFGELDKNIIIVDQYEYAIQSMLNGAK